MFQHERFDFADSAALRGKIDELGLDIPFSDDVSILLEPVRVAGRRVPNRLVVQPMEGCDANEHGGPGGLTRRRYQRFGAGGAGIIWFEATAVVPEGRSDPRQLYLSRSNLDEFKRLAGQTREAARGTTGSGHEALLILQLTHSGRYCRADGTTRPVIAQHNELLDSQQGLPKDYPIVGDEELDRLQDIYLASAVLASEAGFDGVDIKACHGYLVSELLAAHARIDSRYGGPFENRARFLLEVVDRVHREVPELLVTSRINAYDGLPHPYGFGANESPAGGEDVSEAATLLGRLQAAGCPLANVSLGNPYYNPHLGRPFNKPVVGGDTPDEHPLVGVARLLGIVGQLQQAVVELPLVGTGYSWLREFFPHIGAGVVKGGRATFVGVGRLAFAYPDFARDLAQYGKLDPDKSCIACSGCTQIMRDGGCAGCIVRDKEVYGPQYREGRRRACRPAEDDRRPAP